MFDFLTLTNLLVGFVLLVAFGVVFYFLIWPSTLLWWHARVSGARVGILKILIMKLRNVPVDEIVDNLIKAAQAGLRIDADVLQSLHYTGGEITPIVDAQIKAEKAGIPIRTRDLESHSIAGGNVKLIVDSKIIAERAGIKVETSELTSLDLAGCDVKNLVEAKVMAVKAGIETTLDELSSHALAGGDVTRVVKALIAARNAPNIDLNFQSAKGIDLAGRNVLEAVQMTVNTKVIETPLVSAVAKDGIELKVKARVTVRANIASLVGGAGEDTILARVGEGIVSTIGSEESHKNVLENPDKISKFVLGKDLDKGTAYDILSIDIADVDVGKNIGAELDAARAETDVKIAKAKAEQRRVDAIAYAEQMKARVHEMRAKVVESEAKVPLAMAYAFKSGRLGVMDYYRMQNMQSDTKMRENIATANPPPTESEEEE